MSCYKKEYQIGPQLRAQVKEAGNLLFLMHLNHSTYPLLKYNKTRVNYNIQFNNLKVIWFY